MKSRGTLSLIAICILSLESLHGYNRYQAVRYAHKWADDTLYLIYILGIPFLMTIVLMIVRILVLNV